MSEIFSELQELAFQRRQQEAGAGDPPAEPAALTVSADDFSALEQRMYANASSVCWPSSTHWSSRLESGRTAWRNKSARDPNT